MASPDSWQTSATRHPGQEPTSKDLETLDLLIDAVEKDVPALTTLRDLWRFCVKTLSLPENMDQTYPNPSRLASVLISTATITSATSAPRAPAPIKWLLQYFQAKRSIETDLELEEYELEDLKSLKHVDLPAGPMIRADAANTLADICLLTNGGCDSSIKWTYIVTLKYVIVPASVIDFSTHGACRDYQIYDTTYP